MPFESSLFRHRQDEALAVVMQRRRVAAQPGFSLIDIMVAILLISVLAGIALPISAGSISAYRFKGDGQSVVHLAGLAKMRAASQFSRSRLRIDLASRSYSLEIWDKSGGTWVTEGGLFRTSSGVRFSFGDLDEPPPDTQAAIGFSPVCTDEDGDDIGNTACIVFNSRGIPIDSTGAPVGGHGIYLTDDSTGVYAITITATPLIRFWWSPAHTASWQELQ